MVLQKTYSMIKPDAIDHKADIVKMIEKAKFKIVDSKDMEISQELAEEFYAEHQGKGFFADLIEFITSGPVFAMILEKDNAIADFRTFIGATDPKKLRLILCERNSEPISRIMQFMDQMLPNLRLEK